MLENSIAALLRRATVVVENVAAALGEAGDIVLAVSEGALSPDDLVPMRTLIAGDVAPAADRPLVFTSVGLPWQDLVIAEAVLANDNGHDVDR